MESDLILPLVMRWIHMLSALTMVGGSVFLWLVYLPISARILSEEERSRIYDPLLQRWKLVVHPTIILFLVSGFYTYIAVTRFQHEGQAIYHMAFGLKFLAAMVVFALLIVLTSTMSWSVKLREHKGLWWVFMVSIAVVVLLAGFMRVLPSP